MAVSGLLHASILFKILSSAAIKCNWEPPHVIVLILYVHDPLTTNRNDLERDFYFSFQPVLF